MRQQYPTTNQNWCDACFIYLSSSPFHNCNSDPESQSRLSPPLPNTVRVPSFLSQEGPSPYFPRRLASSCVDIVLLVMDFHYLFPGALNLSDRCMDIYVVVTVVIIIHCYYRLLPSMSFTTLINQNIPERRNLLMYTKEAHAQSLSIIFYVYFFLYLIYDDTTNYPPS